MSTDFRALCAELLKAVDDCDDYTLTEGATVARARAALAAEADGPAVPEGREPAAVTVEPSDGDLLQLMPEQFRADLGTVSRMAAHGAGPDIKPGLFRVSLNTGALEYARAVLARYGHQPAPSAEGEVGELALKELERTVVLLMPVTGHKKIKRFGTIRAALKRLQVLENKADLSPAPPPAEGEVAELVAWLRANALTVQKASGNPANGAKQRMNRAAALLEQRHPTPVPVAERLPGPEDCAPWPGEPNAGRWCWMASCVDNGWAWEQRTLGFLASFPQDFTHWLPATDLPLPQGEVQP